MTTMNDLDALDITIDDDVTYGACATNGYEPSGACSCWPATADCGWCGTFTPSTVGA